MQHGRRGADMIDDDDRGVVVVRQVGRGVHPVDRTVDTHDREGIHIGQPRGPIRDALLFMARCIAPKTDVAPHERRPCAGGRGFELRFDQAAEIGGGITAGREVGRRGAAGGRVRVGVV